MCSSGDAHGLRGHGGPGPRRVCVCVCVRVCVRESVALVVVVCVCVQVMRTAYAVTAGLALVAYLLITRVMLAAPGAPYAW